MKKVNLWIIIVMVNLFNPASVYPNGGGVYNNSAVFRSTDSVFRYIKDIQLISEKLFIRPVGNHCEVTVKYVLQNISGKDYTDLDYAFPVDKLTGYEMYQDEPVKSLRFMLNGESLPHVHSPDTIITDMDFGNIPDNREDYFMEGITSSVIRRWYYTRISIPKNAFVNLEVNYSVKTLNRCDGDSPLLLDYHFGGCNFHRFYYDFSPATSWGDGIIWDFYVEIDGTDLELTGEKYKNQDITEKGLFRVSGLPFETVGHKSYYRKRNFDLTNAQPIHINYRTSLKTSLDIISRRRMPDDRFTVRISDVQDKYPVKNLTDMNLESAWIPVKSTGASIEFIFNEPVGHLSGFTLLNGYHKSGNTYEQNNRIKKIKIELKSPGVEEWFTMECDFEDKPYYPVYLDDLFHHAELIDFFDVPMHFYEAIERMKITIEEIYSGTKYDDTCISEIILYTWSSENGHTDNEYY